MLGSKSCSGGKTPPKLFVNWLTFKAMEEEYNLWCESHEIPLEERAQRTCFISVVRSWSDRLGFRKVGQHARRVLLKTFGPECLSPMSGNPLPLPDAQLAPSSAHGLVVFMEMSVPES